EPSPTPMPTLPPVIISMTPAPGAEAPPDTPIEIHFSAPIDPKSAQDAIEISPRVPGEVEVTGNTLRFRPRHPFPWETDVKVRVKTSVKAVNGLPLLRPTYYRFTTMAPLRIARHYPPNNGRNIPIDTTIRLTFNRPIVPLDRTNRPLPLPSWLHIQPELTGHIRWVGTSLLEFTPDPLPRAGTQYTVTVDTSLHSLDQVPLLEPYTFTFQIAFPRVKQVTPTYISPDRKYIWPDKPITITFNMPMDPASVREGVRLVDTRTDEPIPLAFSQVDDRTWVITPTRTLPLGAIYRVEITSRVRAADGKTPLSHERHYTFRVVPPLRVAKTRPKNGSTGVDPYTPVHVFFEGLLQPDSLAHRVLITPTPSYVYSHTWDSQLFLDFPKKAQTTYTITLKAGIRDIFGHALGEDFSFHFTTGDYPPHLMTNWPWGTVFFPVHQPVSITIREMNHTALDIRLYRIAPDKVPQRVPGYARGPMWGEEPELLWEKHIQLPEEKNTWHVLTIPLGGDTPRVFEPGVYQVNLHIPGRRGIPEEDLIYTLAVVPYNVVLKTSNENALVWVTDIRTGEPVSGRVVRLFVGEEAREEGKGTTDKEGLVRVSITRQKPWESVRALVYDEKGNIVGLAADVWDDDINPWAFRLPVDAMQGHRVAYIFTDRPVYRPGQVIHWRLIVREDEDGEYRLPPAGTQAAFKVMDPNGEPVFEGKATLDEFGTASGDIPLPKDAAIGYYFFWAEGLRMLEDRVILVAAYRKPTMEVTLTPARTHVVAGETVQVTMTARYYFGAPVRHARVEYTVVEAPYTFSWECPAGETCPPYSFSDRDWWQWEPFPQPGAPLAKGKGRTDEQGRFVLTLPAKLKEGEGSRRWQVEMAVYDVNGQVVAGRTSVIVHAAGVYPGIAVRSYVVRTGHPVTGDVILVDVEGHPLGHRDVTVVALRQNWHNVRKKDADGIYRWVSEVEETPVYTTTVSLDADARGTFTFTPEKGGSYRLRAIAHDDAGREARSSAFIWVTEENYVAWRRENNNRLFLVADRKTYQVGDTAHVLIPSPYLPPVRALVTLERGTIRRAWTITLTTNSPVLDIPITEDMAPNVFLSVVLIQGTEQTGTGEPSFRVGYVELDVDVSHRLLQVQVEPERKEYHPGDTARFTVRVTDKDGEPVDAEVTLALVDKAVLALFDRPTPMAQIFYRKRGLGVRTGTSMTLFPRRIQWREYEGGKGGGGGGGGVPDIREEFLDVAFWEPALRTGVKGLAQVQVPLPDNLTTWTMLAWAVDRETRVGEGNAEILVTQDFLLRPVLPRFFTRGDAATIGVVAHNRTDTSLRARVTMTVEGAQLRGEATQEVVIAPHGEEKLTWDVTDVRGVKGEAEPVFRVTWVGQTDVAGLSDGLRMTIPVRYPVPPDVVAMAGMVDLNETRMEVVYMPPDREPDMGHLRLDVDASLAAGMLDGLRYLRHYRWECTEQTVSRFLPNVITWRTLRRLKVENKELEQALPDLIAEGVRRLQDQQHMDGGWGWWKGGKSSVYLSAYALWGLTEAKAAGFPVPERTLSAGADFLARKVRTFTPSEKVQENNAMAMALFALSTYAQENGVVHPGLYPAAVNLYEHREDLSIYGRALLGLTFGLLEDLPLEKPASARPAHAYVQDILDDLLRLAVLDPTGAHWEEAQPDYANMGSDVRTTAMVLLLLAREDAENPLAPNVVRWLMAQRRGAHWKHTQDTAWSIIALGEWMEVTGELHPDYDYEAWLNDVLWTRGRMQPEDVGVTHTVMTSVVHLNQDAANWVRLQRMVSPGEKGTGAMYYRLQLTTYPPLEDIKPVSRGIRVERWFTKDEDETRISQARVGELVTVHVRVIAPRGLHYFMLEDFFPAGMEPVDVRLKTSVQAGKEGKEVNVKPLEHPSYWWYWTPSHVELRDDRAGIFERFLSPGTYEITYQVRASVPGTYVVPPARGSLMYEPEVFGWSKVDTFVVTP
ncbi:MAG: hypothetical protein GXO55_10935, partial [Chloroflexi bacterium]|nr:hypothetical protein [Chloroflexota bacterium]